LGVGVVCSVDGGEFDGGEFDGGEFDGGEFDGGEFDGGEFDGGEFDVVDNFFLVITNSFEFFLSVWGCRRFYN